MYSIAADLGGTRIKLGVLQGGRLVATAKLVALPDEPIGVNLDRVSEALRRLLHEQDLAAQPLAGLGLSFPGIVDGPGARVLSRFVKYPGAHAFDFRGWARQAWQLPLALENDARAALLGEWQHGAGRHRRNLVLLTLGTGVGSAVLLEGRLLRGTHHLAGNLGGHSSINLHGRPCPCGFVGCLETEASTWALPALAAAHPRLAASRLAAVPQLEFMHLFAEAAAGDALAQELVQHCLHAWGVAAVNMVHAYDPELLLVGGGIMQQQALVLPALQAHLDRYAWTGPGAVRVAAAEQVEYAALLGLDYLLTQSAIL